MMKPSENPLISGFKTPFETVPFSKLSPEKYYEAFRYFLKNSRKEIKRISRNKQTPTYNNTIDPLEKLINELSETVLILYNLNSVSSDTLIQKISQKISPQLTQFMGKINHNKKLFKRINFLYINREHLNLTNEQKWLLVITRKNMIRSGAHLFFLKKIRFIQIQMRLSLLTLRFNDNVLAENNKFTLHIKQKEKLKGIPAEFVEQAAQLALKKNQSGWIFTLQQPVYMALMKFADDRCVREKMYMAYMSRGFIKGQNCNQYIIRRICNLRLKLAKLAGFKNFAGYTLDERMAKSPDEVLGFIDDLLSKSWPYAMADLEQVKNHAKALGFTFDFMPWDYSYYAEKLKTQKIGFDEETIKPFFSLPNVCKAIFDLANTLYGITIEQVTGVDVYHSDVKTYKVTDRNGDFLAILYVDFFAREKKQGGAWMTEYRQQSCIGGKMVRPHVSICCNFSPPTGQLPTLLTFSEVNTFLHEFGHALHGIFSNVTYPSISGTNVFRDFVELPSQIMENWLYQKQWLQSFARHYKTGEPIPQYLIEKLTEIRNFQSGYQTVRQLSFAYLDMDWHSLTKKFTGKVCSFEKEKLKRTNLLPELKNTCISTSFSHIFGGGYAAGYYGYKWAEVLDADAFSAFEEKGIFDTGTAQRFRVEILAKGGSDHPMNLYRNFRGSKPSIKYLLKRSGLCNN